MNKKRVLLFFIAVSLQLSFVSSSVWAKKKIKGVLSEIQVGKGKNAEENDQRALQAEILVSWSEQKAVKYLKRLIKRSKGRPNEADLWYRLSELYMRRAKSGRFFDLTQEDRKGKDKSLSLSISGSNIAASEKKMLQKAIDVYGKMQRSFQKFPQMDSVVFNHAFAYQRLENDKAAEKLYRKLVEKYPQSKMIYDSYIAIGEIRYKDQDFFEAVENFRMVEKNPNSRLYAYAIYKKGWALYNMQSFNQAVISMKRVAFLFDTRNKNNLLKRKVYNLRKESLNDLALFYYDLDKPKTAYKYFDKVALNDEELSKMIFKLTSLYENYFREEDAIPIMLSYVRKNKKSPRRAEGYLFLVNSSHKTYEYSNAYKYLRVMHKLCLPKSKWIRVQGKGFSSEVCKKDVNVVNLALINDWWKLWKRAKDSKSNNLDQFVEVKITRTKNASKKELEEQKEKAQKKLLFAKRLRGMKPEFLASLVEKSFFLYLKRPGIKEI